MPKGKSKKKDDKINIFKNRLVPECEILKDEERDEFLEKYNISKYQLPSILSKDPLVKAVGAKKGEILKIKRKTGTAAGESNYYRLVVGGSN